MRVGRRIVTLLGIMPLASCAVLGPAVDADMEDAPYEACVRFAEAAPPEPGQCLSVQIRPAGGRWQPVTGNALNPGDELLALPSGAPQCQHGNYTHFVLEGASDAGALRITVPDGFGRGSMGRHFPETAGASPVPVPDGFGPAHKGFTYAWNEPRGRWTADNIGTTLHIPAGARVWVSEGSVRLGSACFKSYTHLRDPARQRHPLL